RTFTSLSLCSHQIRILVFPLLYRHVIFKRNAELSQFRARVISEASGENLIDELRVADHVHHLEFGGGSNVDYDADELELLASALQHMKALRGLTWSAVLPEDPTTFSAIGTACKSLQNLSLHLEQYFDGDDDNYMSTLFGFKGLTRFEISAPRLFLDSGKLPSSMIDMIRASPNLVSLDLSLETYGDPHPKWDIDTLFRSIDIAPTTLRLRKAADLDFHAFLIPRSPHPFVHSSFEEDFAHGPPSLNLPPDTFPVLREFEGTIYWCSQLSKLQVASKLESLTVLSECTLFEDGKCDMFLEALRAFSSLKALHIINAHISNAETFLSTEDLKAIVKNAAHLESLTCNFFKHVTEDTIGSQLSCLNLRALASNILRYAGDIPNAEEEYVRTLAKYCPSLVTVEDLEMCNCGIRWVATILRKEGGIDLEVSQTRI
ncbi:hypothetical protein BDZ89DRAFT_1087251, partial [Hymenopellis radicata]